MKWIEIKKKLRDVQSIHNLPPKICSLILHAFCLFTDRKLCVKARLTGALQVTMNMVKNNTTFFKVLQPALQVLKLYSANCKLSNCTCSTLPYIAYMHRHKLGEFKLHLVHFSHLFLCHSFFRLLIPMKL